MGKCSEGLADSLEKSRDWVAAAAAKAVAERVAQATEAALPERAEADAVERVAVEKEAAMLRSPICGAVGRLRFLSRRPRAYRSSVRQAVKT